MGVFRLLSTSVVLLLPNLVLPAPASEAPLPATLALATDSVSGTSVVVAAQASDDVGVAGVQFLLDGVALGQEDLAAPYSMVWDTTTVPDGTHTLAARARDFAGNESTSDAVPVVVDNGSLADVTPPLVAATSPTSGETVAAIVAVSATAEDDVGVVGVQFLLDGAPLGQEDTSAPWGVSWDTTGVADGNHTIQAVARDAAGNIATSAAVIVDVENSVPDTFPPTVVTTAPGDGQTVSGQVALGADAIDDVGVAGVQFLIDGEHFGATQTLSPYSIVWDTTGVSDGSHTIAALAWDEAGNSATSLAVVVDVENTPDEEPQPGTLPEAHLELVFEPVPDRNEIIVRGRSEAPGVHQLALMIDGQQMYSAEGASLEYAWDTRPLVGRHEVHLVGYDTLMQVVTSSSAYQVDVEPTTNSGNGRGRGKKSVSGPQVGIMLGIHAVGEGDLVAVTAVSGMSGIRSTELYIDGERVTSARRGRPVEYIWDLRPGSGPHELVVSALDRRGVLAVASVIVP